MKGEMYSPSRTFKRENIDMKMESLIEEQIMNDSRGNCHACGLGRLIRGRKFDGEMDRALIKYKLEIFKGKRYSYETHQKIKKIDFYITNLMIHGRKYGT